MALVYLDLIKLAVPASVRGVARETKSQYVAFGTYDMLHYALPDETGDCGMQWLEQQHERRHNLDWNHERHPVHCYCPDAFACEAGEALSRDKYPTRPLVVTMVRVSKYKLAAKRHELDFVLASLQSQLDAIKSSMQVQDVSIIACWNLGNADFLILSRPTRLSFLRDLYLSLSADALHIIDDRGIETRIEFMSFSSYCAFPALDKYGMQIAESDLREWLRLDSDLQFVGLVDTLANSQISNSQLGSRRFLLGDRDYQLLDVIDDQADYNTRSVVSIAREILAPNGSSIIQSSSLIPSLPMTDVDTNERVLSRSDLYGLNWGEVEITRLDIESVLMRMCRFIDAEGAIFQRLGPGFVSQIQHCKNTLDALYKYAVRLYAAAHQDDVFSIIRDLYETLTLILEDNLAYMHKLRERGDDDAFAALRGRVPNTHVEVMRFVSELQHVFTVLAISPHSHMETYYGSMRSLNASSKLWTSYNGVAKVLCELFPARNQGRIQSCSVLMVPYREKQSQSGRIVPDTYSDSILVHMQLNYQTMFDTKTTLFVIAHELGHYVFNETRRIRCDFLLRTYISNIISNEFGDMLDYPLYTLAMASRNDGLEELTAYKDLFAQCKSTSATVGQWRKTLCLNICKELDVCACEKLYDKMVDELRDEYLRTVRSIIDECVVDFNKNYEAVKKEVDRYEFYYGSDVMSQILEFFNVHAPSYLGRVYRGIAGANARFLQGVSKYEGSGGVVFDHYQLVGLRTYWNDAAKNDAIAPRTSLEASRRFAGFDKSILELFREIHAEVFACKIIDFQLRDYLDHVANYADAFPRLIMQPDDLHKIMVVCETALGDDGCDGLIRWISADDTCPFALDLRDAAIAEIASIRKRPYYRHVKDYGSRVAQRVDDRVYAELAPSERKLLEKVRTFARDKSNTPRHMWRFWLEVMQ